MHQFVPFADDARALWYAAELVWNQKEFFSFTLDVQRLSRRQHFVELGFQIAAQCFDSDDHGQSLVRIAERPRAISPKTHRRILIQKGHSQTPRRCHSLAVQFHLQHP